MLIVEPSRWSPSAGTGWQANTWRRSSASCTPAPRLNRLLSVRLSFADQRPRSPVYIRVREGLIGTGLAEIAQDAA